MQAYMRLRAGPIWVLIATLASGCFYVSDDYYQKIRDADQDGWGFDDDCNDDDERVYPGAGDVYGDGCDADCGYYENDADGDDWPDSVDCKHEDPTIFPCNPAESDTDDIDHDCDGETTARTDICPTVDTFFPDAGAISGGCETTD
jgi:hypothetical protein